jgi:hypothetical protein
VAGLLGKGQGEDMLEIGSRSIVVSTDGRARPGTMLVGQTFMFKPTSGRRHFGMLQAPMSATPV